MRSAIKAIARKVNPGLVLLICYLCLNITVLRTSAFRESNYHIAVFGLLIVLAGYGFSFRKKENLPAMNRYDWLVVAAGVVVFIVSIGGWNGIPHS